VPGADRGATTIFPPSLTSRPGPGLLYNPGFIRLCKRLSLRSTREAITKGHLFQAAASQVHRSRSESDPRHGPIRSPARVKEAGALRLIHQRQRRAQHCPGGLVFTAYTDGTFAAYDDKHARPAMEDHVGTGLQMRRRSRFEARRASNTFAIPCSGIISNIHQAPPRPDGREIGAEQPQSDHAVLCSGCNTQCRARSTRMKADRLLRPRNPGGGPAKYG